MRMTKPGGHSDRATIFLSLKDPTSYTSFKISQSSPCHHRLQSVTPVVPHKQQDHCVLQGQFPGEEIYLIFDLFLCTSSGCLSSQGMALTLFLKQILLFINMADIAKGLLAESFK